MFCCAGIPVAVKCAGIPVAVNESSAPRSPDGPVEKEDAKTRCTCGWMCEDYVGEKRNVLIVSVLVPIIIDLGQRSETQRGIEVLGM